MQRDKSRQVPSVGVKRRGIGAAIAMLLVSGVTAAVVHEPSAAKATQVRTAAPPPVADEPTTTTTVSAAAAPSTTAVTAALAPRTTAAPRPVQSAAPAPKAKAPAVRSGNFGPRPPGSISFPYDPARTSWSARINGIDMSLSIDRQRAAAGSPVSFTLTATDSTKNCCGLTVLFGDGTHFDRGLSGCESAPKAPGTSTVTTTHPYNGDGRWEFLFEAISGGCQPGVDPTYAVFYGWVDITPGTRTSNGPAQPTIQGGWGYSPDGTGATGRVARVGGHGHDDDGFVHHFEINWGDGTTSTSPGDYMGCRTTAGGWPATSDAWYPPNGSHDPPTHEYGADGDYTVTVTVHSIGCDGTDLQTASWSAVWHTAGPNP